MPRYTQKELNERTKIIESQKLLHKFLTSDTINVLINLFDMNINNNTINKNKIVKLIEDERKNKHLNSSNVIIRSDYFGLNKNKSAFYLGIIKNNKDYIHLTIHLVPKSFNPKQTGIIHIDKDIYKEINPNSNISTYALILVEKPQNMT